MVRGTMKESFSSSSLKLIVSFSFLALLHQVTRVFSLLSKNSYLFYLFGYIKNNIFVLKIW